MSALEGAAKRPLGIAASVEAPSSEGGGRRWLQASPVRLTLAVAAPSVTVEKRRTLCRLLLVAGSMHLTDLGSGTRDGADWHSPAHCSLSPSTSFGVCIAG